MNDFNIGRKIRQIRNENKLTLEEVAHRTGYTKSYISLLESGKKFPPIATLSKISHALSVDITVFFKKKNHTDHITLVRANKRETVVRNSHLFGYRYETIAPTTRPKKMEPFVITLPCKSEDRSLFDHEGEELLFVLSGKVRFLYGEIEYLLNKGDSIYFDSSIPHRGEGGGGKAAKALVVIYNY
jgi:transcriptional regulator with XRE-family HTH domain